MISKYNRSIADYSFNIIKSHTKHHMNLMQSKNPNLSTMGTSEPGQGLNRSKGVELLVRSRERGKGGCCRRTPLRENVLGFCQFSRKPMHTYVYIRGQGAVWACSWAARGRVAGWVWFARGVGGGLGSLGYEIEMFQRLGSIRILIRIY